MEVKNSLVGLINKRLKPREAKLVNDLSLSSTHSSIIRSISTGSAGGASSADESSPTVRKKTKKRDRSPITESVLAQNEHLPVSVVNCVGTGSSGQPPPPLKKEKQRPENWTKLEQQIFFNALRQNGKNFESITQYFNVRQKRYKLDNGVSVQKSKEQIRHFYYRTWHKVLKYISMPSLKADSSTATTTNTTVTITFDSSQFSLRDMQVKCLIAFNLLMTKLHQWNKKAAIKLVELINQGWTTIREKGKLNRLRMPVCKISAKPVEPSTSAIATALPVEKSDCMPDAIHLHLEPRSENAYCRVHRLAQNPFLNIEIQTVQTVKFLIEFLESKWKSRRDQFNTHKSTTAQASNPSSKSNTSAKTQQQQTTSTLMVAPSSHLVTDNDFQRQTDEQSNNTRKLLSDLSCKRRSRQRKQIMVVNTSNSRMPSKPSSAVNSLQQQQQAFVNEAGQQQNIVYSGPVAAIARTIVNNSFSGSFSLLPPATQSPPVVATDSDISVNDNSSKLLIPSFHNAFSALRPHLFNNLTDSSNSNSNYDENEYNQANSGKEAIACETSPSHTRLTDLSLLDMSMNNVDSLFGSSVNQEKLPDKTVSSFGLSSTGLSLGIQRNSSTNNLSSGYSLVHKRSDIIEWTDSMADVSLTGILNDMQSPIKQSNGSANVFVENSRDSIFFSDLNTIMEIMPTTSNQFAPSDN